jgi:hypothetical protein
MEALQAIRLALPWKWTDYFNAYHALRSLPCDKFAKSGTASITATYSDVEDMLINGIISIYKVLLGKFRYQLFLHYSKIYLPSCSFSQLLFVLNSSFFQLIDFIFVDSLPHSH